MSRRQPSEEQRRLLATGCGDCGARPGEWCLADSGAWSQSIHDDRIGRPDSAPEIPERDTADAHERLMLAMTVERFGPIPGRR